MPKIDIASIPLRTGTTYPAEFRSVVDGRERRPLGDAGGLTQFGVNLTRLRPGAASALRHWHEEEDELVYIVEGELVLVEDGGETLMRPGDVAAFKAGVADGHHLVNRSRRDALLLEIGTRAARERCHYSDVDLEAETVGGRDLYTHRSGEPYA
jgi:uncharacterized cupin superfamily protein